jgi:hypothetical protein
MASFAYQQLEAVPGIAAPAELLYFPQDDLPDTISIFSYKLFPVLMLIKEYLP